MATRTSASPNHFTSNHSTSPSIAARRPSNSMNITLPSRPAMGSRGQSQDNSAGPVRHPRPLTFTELHLQLENEQEAVVNRLTRELSALRAHSASVTSTTSTTTTASTSAVDPSFLEPSSQYIIPTSSRRHRSSSNLSAGSNRSNTAAPLPITQPGPNIPPTSGTSQASVDRARDAAGLSHVSSRSRQNSNVLPIRSGAPSPSLSMHQHHTGDGTAPTYVSHRASMSSLNGYGGTGTGHTPARSPSVSSARYEEVAHARAALESARSENEMLMERIKELERELRRKSRAAERGEGVGQEA